MTPTELNKLRALRAKWRNAADWMMSSTKPDEYQIGSAGYLRQCASDLDALIAELEKGQA